MNELSIFTLLYFVAIAVLLCSGLVMVVCILTNPFVKDDSEEGKRNFRNFLISSPFATIALVYLSFAPSVGSHTEAAYQVAYSYKVPYASISLQDEFSLNLPLGFRSVVFVWSQRVGVENYNFSNPSKFIPDNPDFVPNQPIHAGTILKRGEVSIPFPYKNEGYDIIYQALTRFEIDNGITFSHEVSYSVADYVRRLQQEHKRYGSPIILTPYLEEGMNMSGNNIHSLCITGDECRIYVTNTK